MQLVKVVNCTRQDVIIFHLLAEGGLCWASSTLSICGALRSEFL